MRLKSVNIGERSSVYSNEQKERLKSISQNINKIGEIFDIIVDLEMYIIDNVEKHLNDFILIKTNKEKITREEGEDRYLNFYFKNAAEKLDLELKRVAVSWDERSMINKLESHTISSIRNSIENYKRLYSFINPIVVKSSEYKIEGFEALKNIIEEFGNFRIYKVLTSNNVTEKLNILIDLKSKIEGTKSFTKKITIEDL